VLVLSLAVTYFHTGNPHYHRRGAVSRSCSGWEGVGPARCGHQAVGARQTRAHRVGRAGQRCWGKKYGVHQRDCLRRDCDCAVVRGSALAGALPRGSPRNPLAWGYRIKPHGQLVLVSSTHYCASTPSLSTSWSRTTLQGPYGPGGLILRRVSRLDAFSGYLFRI
jgi:hypothetical protein